MAQENESNNKAMGWFIGILAMLALGLGIGVLYVKQGFGSGTPSNLSSMEGYQGRQQKRVEMLKEIKLFLAPSLKTAYEKSDSYVSQDTIRDTKSNVEKRLAGLGADEEIRNKAKISEPSESTAPARERWIRVAMDVKLEDLTKQEIMDVLSAVVDETGKYATIEGILLEAQDLKPKEMHVALDERSFLWELNFKLRWFVPNPKYTAKPTSGRGN